MPIRIPTPRPLSCRIQIGDSSVEYFKYPGHASSGLGNGTRPAARETNGIVTADGTPIKWGDYLTAMNLASNFQQKITKPLRQPMGILRIWNAKR